MLEGCVPWPAGLARRYRERGYWNELTLFDVLARSAQAHPDKVALVDGACRLSYAELLQRTEALAAGLYASDLRAGDRVVFQLANGMALVQTFFALARIGVIPVMALPAHRETEITHFARASGAVALLVPEAARGFDYRAMAKQVQAQCPALRQVLVDGDPGPGQTALRDLAAAGSAVTGPQPPSDEVALMLLSGGTTGLPKLIPRTHTDYLCGSLQSGRVAGLGRHTVLLAVLPMAHNYTLGAPGVVATLAFGGCTIIAPGTTAEIVFPLIAQERVTLVCAAAPLVSKWLASDEPEKHDLSSLKTLMCGGAKLAAELRQRVEQRLGCTYQESYGTAEGLLNMSRLDDAEALRMRSSGRPVHEADEIKIIDEQGKELPDGQAGELIARGPYTIRGYYRAPEINARAFTADGFYRMGDVARIVDGYLYLEGRIKELINRGGEKISCEEIENHILAHPQVEAACVVAMPDEIFGEKACAAVILRHGGALTLIDLLRFLQGRNVARFKMPERLEVVQEFPLSPAGKVLRRELQARLARPMPT